ncbi:SDR family NAD(P)-dependent oxidoreductase, partial [bacterium]|nr:SDR family NAD(P)-dependent oxidoreductase [bacterium]
MELQGKTAIVTGAGRGIGRAIAVEFARQGANVVCAARSQAEVIETAALAQKEGVQARAIPTDVTDRDQVENLVSQTLAEFGQIDVLFNNAGRFHAIGAVWEVDPADWWKDVTVNV